MPHADQFASMIAGLQRHGLTRTQIAERTGLSRPTIWRLANKVNRDCFTDTYQRVEALYDRVVINGSVKTR